MSGGVDMNIQSGPCKFCGATNYPISFGGPFCCPSCDCGPNVPGLHRYIENLKDAIRVANSTLIDSPCFCVDDDSPPCKRCVALAKINKLL